MAEQPDRPTFRLSPLTAALLIPALCLAVVATLWLGSHVRGAAPRATTTPNAVLPSASAGPTPWPLVWPGEDGGSDDPQRAYGVLAIVPAGSGPLGYTATLDANAALPAPQAEGATGSVQRLQPLPLPTAEAIALRLGSATQPTESNGLTDWPDIGAVYAGLTSTFRVPRLDAPGGRLASNPRDTAGAASAAAAWLVQHGLTDPMAPVAAVQVSRGDLAAFPTWQITAPHLSGQSDATEITMTVSGSGQVSNLVIVHPLVAGAAQYPTVDWQAAWAQVQAGRARDVDSAAGGDGVPATLHIDRVALTARIVQTRSGAFVVPAYGFTDSASRVTLYWPALDPSTYTLG
ncbi:MAG TPA: hypothetical protein VFC09_00885 [Candidatus Dormibacteraeota bacterium]|nr:hypothetical protein [Candidatus Dormibacteraeota bacterium]